MHKIIKNIVKRIYFYSQPRSYSVEYQVKITNLQSTDNKFYIILPLPLNTDYQSVTSQIIHNPKSLTIKSDSLYHNKYAIWQFRLVAQASQTLCEKFKITVKPRKNIFANNFSLADYPKNLNWLSPNRFLNSNDPRIQQLAKKIAGSEKNIFAIIKKLNAYVISNVKYANPITGLYSAKDALQKKEVDCGGFNALLASFCISLGIPSRIVSGFWAGYPSNKMHAWVEMQLPDGQWLPADPSIENLGSKKSGQLGWLGSDRIAFSIGCDIPVEVNNRIIYLDILQNPIIISESSSESLDIKVNFITTNE